MFQPLAAFEPEVLRAFDFLVRDYGLKRTKAGAHVSELWVVFTNDKTSVRVIFELLVGPTVQVGRMSARVPGRVVEDYDLELLLEERQVSRATRPRVSEPTDPQLPEILSQLARDLRDHGADVLGTGMVISSTGARILRARIESMRTDPEMLVEIETEAIAGA